MWCTPGRPSVVSSVLVLFTQHLPSRPGSHQHLLWSCSVPQLFALRHLLMTSPGNSARCDRLVIKFIVPGLLTWSCEIADVSVTPGRACVNICHSMLVFGIPEPKSSDMREYWLPTSPLMFSHFGCAGYAGGLSGSNAMWHEPQAVPIRNGGSTEASASLLTRSSDGMPVVLIICLRKPSQFAT